MPNTIVPEWLMLLVNILLYFALAKSQPNCLNSPTFENNSTYQANLNTIISSLSSNIGSSGFYSASIGQGPDRVNAIVLCRGDISLPACRTCVDATAPELVRRCAYNRDAIFWNETCLVRYSSQPIYGQLQLVPVSPNPSTSRVSNPKQHNGELRALLESLKGHAANGGSFKKAAAGNRTSADFEAIFALEQCTPDLSVEDCTKCLTEAINYFPTCCSGIIGAGILRPSCTLRFENYRFYNASTVLQVPQGPLHLGKGDDTTTRTAIIVAVSVAACVALAVTVGILLRKRRKEKLVKKFDTPVEICNVESIQFDFGKIRAATNDFSDANKLGQDGFGALYRGKLQNGREIVVKKLSTDSRKGNLEFKNEVLSVAKLQNKNLVRLLGFSLQETEGLLVYEFVRNGGLDKFIFDPIKRSNLNWNKRCKIIDGIARGLLYLHEDSQLGIVHHELKAQNILLDREMNPKISNFGMTKLFVRGETQESKSRAVGTNGSMSSESAKFEQSFDVFSFGVLVLEIISGRKNNFSKNEENVDDLLNSAWENWCHGTATNIIDPVLKADTNSLRDMLRCIHIALLCVQENVTDRPTMARVVLMLNYFSVTLPLPSNPAPFRTSKMKTYDST